LDRALEAFVRADELDPFEGKLVLLSWASTHRLHADALLRFDRDAVTDRPEAVARSIADARRAATVAREGEPEDPRPWLFLARLELLEARWSHHLGHDPRTALERAGARLAEAFRLRPGLAEGRAVESYIELLALELGVAPAPDPAAATRRLERAINDDPWLAADYAPVLRRLRAVAAPPTAGASEVGALEVGAPRLGRLRSRQAHLLPQEAEVGRRTTFLLGQPLLDLL
ncbi:MAG: hypothetical protein MI919_38190, partial [Holophagales bacterium]|nr:hypothetical protein [Holophagales bacterium]